MWKKAWIGCGVICGILWLATMAIPLDAKELTPAERVERLTMLLQLTPEQQAQTKDIVQRRGSALNQLFHQLSQAKGADAKKEVKMRILEAHQKFREEFNAILTNAQQMRYEDFVYTKRKEMMKKS